MTAIDVSACPQNQRRKTRTRPTYRPRPHVTHHGDATITITDEHPYAGGISTDIYRGILSSPDGNQRVVVKRWRLCTPQISETSRKEFLRDLTSRLECWQSLRHRNIAQFRWPILGLGQFPAMALQCYRNGNVLDYIRAHPSVNVLQLLIDIAEALDFMHNMKPAPVAHGALKGSNILVNDAGTACLSDIGISLIPIPPTWTLDTTLYSRWLAPEIILPGSADHSIGLASPEADVYSFAMTAIEMTTGRRPFSHRSSHIPVVLDVIRGKRPRRPTLAEAPQMTDDLWELVTSCWAQDPESRPLISEVRALLQLWANSA
ncbi:hypothetical protein HGRIS_006013 [Hohenbuehelia grisea]|uniref:Protein kinase domain-containing protein n=1 Tax=Hohenbuehelia grisea TaxID=104357 RepID=A0ABR3JZ22_9AGAR